jgi:hypothetical protein
MSSLHWFSIALQKQLPAPQLESSMHSWQEYGWEPQPVNIVGFALGFVLGAADGLVVVFTIGDPVGEDVGGIVGSAVGVIGA